MSFEFNKMLGGRFLNELGLKLVIAAHSEGNVHPGTILRLHTVLIVALRRVNIVVEQARALQ
jgi:hypothetical protein